MGKYLSKQDIQNGITQNVIPKFKESLDFSVVKPLLEKESQNIPPAIVNVYKGFREMDASLKGIKDNINASSAAHVALYNSLAREVNTCHDLSTSTDGRFVSYDSVHVNICYISEFAEFIGYVSSHIEELLI